MIMRRPLIAGNWKMNTTVVEAVDLVKEMVTALDKVTAVDKVICPPFLSLTEVKKVVKNTTIGLGAQNMYYAEKGAYTGEISPPMLVGLCDYVILGHSERRQYFGESDEIVNKKVKAALNAGIIPILCVGESLKDNEANNTSKILTDQITNGLAGIVPINRLVIAYEPIWAIGTGKAATGKQANVTISFIRNILASVLNKEIAEEIRILYGGSVTGSNIEGFIIESDIDGALVGGASLKADEFLTIVKQTSIIKSTR
jgi:triosephosphate isomerase